MAQYRVLLAVAGSPTGLYRPVAKRHGVESVVYTGVSDGSAGLYYDPT